MSSVGCATALGESLLAYGLRTLLVGVVGCGTALGEQYLAYGFRTFLVGVALAGMGVVGLCGVAKRGGAFSGVTLLGGRDGTVPSGRASASCDGIKPGASPPPWEGAGVFSGRTRHEEWPHLPGVVRMKLVMQSPWLTARLHLTQLL